VTLSAPLKELMSRRAASSCSKDNEMLLQDKNAVVWGGSGAIGSAVARAFAREGARVFLAGRTLAELDHVAREIPPQVARSSQ
jgi:NADP-dependent 3-hydroxy acid dehydrogenase YdfG